MTDGFNDNNKTERKISKTTTSDNSNKVSVYEQLGADLGKLVGEKNKAYGDSFHRAGEFLRILYPDGIKPEQYTDVLCIVRIFDKLKRIATDKDALGESPYRDIGGYALLGLEHSERQNQG